MKHWRIDLIVPVATLALLAACGPSGTTDRASVAEDGESSATVASRDWMPAALVLPQPHTVLQETRLGTRTYLLQILVEKDPKPQLAGWKTGLEAEGYEVNENLIADGRLLFVGRDVESGQIAVSQPEDQQGYLVQVDVSQNVN